MRTETLSTLKINKLSQEQYDRELANGNIDENAIYLTPDTDLDLAEVEQTLKEQGDEIELINSKKVDKESIVTEITEDATDDTIPTGKAVFDLIQSEKQFTSLSNPNLWELTNGLYEIVNGFYYNTNGGYYELDTANYWMFVTKLETISGVICYIYRLGLLKYKITITSSDGVDFSGLISEYNRECTSISDTSTNYETPTAKAVYDFVQNAIQEALYVDEEETV